MDFKIERGQLHTCDKYGNKLMFICDNVAFATYDEKQQLFLVTSLNGEVRTRDRFGNKLIFICENAVEARFSGTDIAVRRKDGLNELRNRYGSHIRTY